MRGSDLTTLLGGPRHAPATLSSLALALVLVGCKGGDAPAPAPSEQASAKAESPAGSKAKAEPAPTAPADPQRADELADLDDLCAALDHDYKDGTLRDYYAKVEMRTEWGKAQLEAGDEAMQPGRLLEKAVAELDPSGDAPELGNCRTLLDYIDDVE